MKELISGLPNFGAKAHYLFSRFTEKGQSFAFFSREEENLEVFLDALVTWADGRAVMPVLLTPEPGALATALYEIATAKTPLAVCATYDMFLTPLPDRGSFLSKVKTLRATDVFGRGMLIDLLVSLGYKRVDFTETHGEFAVRGSVVDVFCPGDEYPSRLYFSGSTIETVSSFEIDTQNTRGHKDGVVILPLEFGEAEGKLADWVGGAYVFDEPGPEEEVNLPEDALIIPTLPTGAHDAGLKANIKFNANMALLKKEVDSLSRQGYKIIIYCLNRGEQDRMVELLSGEGVKNVELKIAPVTQGFYDVNKKLAYITSSEILNRAYHTSTLVKNFDIEGTKRVHFKDLVAGDYIVHHTHGIGRYLGLKVLDGDVPTDCLLVEFRKGSRLYVPVADFTKVQKYIGLKGRAPTLSSLGGVTWRETKQRVKENARQNAEEILRFEAERLANPAMALTGDEHVEREFADSFPYSETPDQTAAIADILQNLTSQRPMERVLVGDVGFGKTEVAMRAALRAAMSGAQTLLLVPTTVLAAQHYKTFSARLAGFPVRVEMMSRFQTKAEQKIVLEKIKAGSADIVVGTHRLLSKDVNFKTLGLVIIDEEHRFGVKQKEKIKAKSKGVHTLFLSATPIPRTLNQSLSSLKDLSVIETPPQGRMPIKTVLMPWNQDVCAHAVRQEIARGGQIFYVYNRVKTMETRLSYLQGLVPEAKICMAHGQMKEGDLEQALWDFYNKKYDILLASTIIENGLDVTNANTLIIEQAQDFGLAQMYQLRGRIGRGDKKAYCYLFHPDWLFKDKDAPKEDTYEELLAFTKKTKEKDPTEEAKKRLSALTEFSELGSGFKLALRDMEIRGAGELLGVKQHGFASEVGLSMYVDLVSAEVKKLKGIPVERKLKATVNVPFAAFIPPEYLPDDNERLRFYKELMDADAAKTTKILERMADFCGPLPQEVKMLARVTLMSYKAGQKQVRHVEVTKDFVEIFFIKHAKLKEGAVSAVIDKYGVEHIKFLPSPKGDGLRIDVRAADPVAFAESALEFL